MGDKEFKIKMTVDASQGVAGSHQQADALKEVKKVSEDTGKSGVATEEALTKATEKTVSAKTRLQSAIRGVALQIPFIGRFAAALNPVTATIAGITLAIYKVKQELETFEMPDVATHKAAITGMAEGLKSYSESMKAIATDAASVETHLKNSQQALQQTLALMKQVREDQGKKEANPLTEREAARAEYEMELAAAADIRRRGQGKISQAGRIGVASKEQDEMDLAEMAKAAAAAQKEVENREGKIRDITAATDPNGPDGWGGIWSRTKVLSRQVFGLKDTQTLYDVDQEKLDSARNVVEQYEARKRQMASRDELRDKRSELFTEGPQDIATAEAMRRLAEQRWQAANARYAGQLKEAGLPMVVTPGGSGFGVTAQGAQAYRHATDRDAEFDRAWEYFTSKWINALKRSADEADAINARRKNSP